MGYTCSMHDQSGFWEQGLIYNEYTNALVIDVSLCATGLKMILAVSFKTNY